MINTRRLLKQKLTTGLILLGSHPGSPVAAAAFSPVHSCAVSSTSLFFRSIITPTTNQPGHSLAKRKNRSSLRSMPSSLGNNFFGDGVDFSSSLPTKWADVLSKTNDNNSNYHYLTKNANHLFPPLTSSSHKGSHGRIAIFGGSDKYTGAPYYAAQSALHCGVDLATIFCAQEAAIPIKCYSPELMVQSVYSVEELNALLNQEEILLEESEQCKQTNALMTNEMNEMEMSQTMEKLKHSEEKQHFLIQSELKKKDDEMEILVERLAKIKEIEEQLSSLRAKQEAYISTMVDTITAMFPTLHTLCIGPGLGRHPLVFMAVEKVIRKAMDSRLTLVLDADVLFMLSLADYRSLLTELRMYERCVMTPNAMEMKRLNDGASSTLSHAGEEDMNIVVQKGHVDKIIQGDNTIHCEEEGGLKRSGGIGDVLAGTISAFMAWNAILEERNNVQESNSTSITNKMQRQQQQRMFASWAACVAVKRATRVAYQKKRRAMSAMDVMDQIGEALGEMEGALTLELCNQLEQQPKKLQE